MKAYERVQPHLQRNEATGNWTITTSVLHLSRGRARSQKQQMPEPWVDGCDDVAWVDTSFALKNAPLLGDCLLPQLPGPTSQ